jgi:hypothetical protein
MRKERFVAEEQFAVGIYKRPKRILRVTHRCWMNKSIACNDKSETCKPHFQISFSVSNYNKCYFLEQESPLFQ